MDGVIRLVGPEQAVELFGIRLVGVNADTAKKAYFTLDQQAMLATWQQHTYAEFVLKDADAALATVTENPYVFLISSGTRRTGRAAVREFYANHFLPEPALLRVGAAQMGIACQVG